MAMLTPSEKHWQVVPTRCLPSPSILTRFATESTAGWQAPRNRQQPFDRLMSPWGLKAEVLARQLHVCFAPYERTSLKTVAMSASCQEQTWAADTIKLTSVGRGRHCDRHASSDILATDVCSAHCPFGSCQRDVPRSRFFSGSVEAVGRHRTSID